MCPSPNESQYSDHYTDQTVCRATRDKMCHTIKCARNEGRIYGETGIAHVFQFRSLRKPDPFLERPRSERFLSRFVARDHSYLEHMYSLPKVSQPRDGSERLCPFEIAAIEFEIRESRITNPKKKNTRESVFYNFPGSSFSSSSREKEMGGRNTDTDVRAWYVGRGRSREFGLGYLMQGTACVSGIGNGRALPGTGWAKKKSEREIWRRKLDLDRRKIDREIDRKESERASEQAGANGAVTLECCDVVCVIDGVSSDSTLAAFGNRCSCTDAKLSGQQRNRVSSVVRKIWDPERLTFKNWHVLSQRYRRCLSMYWLLYPLSKCIYVVW